MNEDRRMRALAYVQRNAPKGDPQGVLMSLDEFSREYTFLMNVGPEKGAFLGAQATGLGAGARALELGCFCGYSAVVIGNALGPGGRLVSVDIDPTSIRAAEGVVAHAGLAERVEFVCGDAAAVIPTLERTFDLVFIDHEKDHYRDDLEAIEAAGLLRPGSVIVADNVGPMFHPEAYLEHVRSSGRYDSEYFPAHIEYTDAEDAVEISVFRG